MRRPDVVMRVVEILQFDSDVLLIVGGMITFGSILTVSQDGLSVQAITILAFSLLVLLVGGLYRILSREFFGLKIWAYRVVYMLAFNGYQGLSGVTRRGAELDSDEVRRAFGLEPLAELEEESNATSSSEENNGRA